LVFAVETPLSAWLPDFLMNSFQQHVNNSPNLMFNVPRWQQVAKNTSL